MKSFFQKRNIKFFFKKKKKNKKKERDGLMQRMSHGRDQWQMNLHGLDWLAQLRHDTQQWSREPSIAHAILNACGSWKSFLKMFFFEENSNDIFWTKPPFLFFFCSKYFPSSKKVQKKVEKPIFSRMRFFKGDFLGWKNFKKDENTRKNRTEKAEEMKKNTTSAKEFLGQLKNRNEFLQQKWKIKRR